MKLHRVISSAERLLLENQQPGTADTPDNYDHERETEAKIWALANNPEYVAELQKHALPLIDLLHKYHGPCYAIHITWDRCCVTSDEIILPRSDD